MIYADLLAGEYSKIEHDVITLEDQPPCIAVSSLFTLEGVTKDAACLQF